MAATIGELRSAEVRDSYASISLEELVDQQIEALTGEGTPSHPTRLQRITKVKDDLLNSLDGIKATPPSAFRRRSSEDTGGAS